MRRMQWQYKSAWSPTQSESIEIHPLRKVIEDLRWWMEERNVVKGAQIGVPPPATLLYTDASLEGRGAHVKDLQTSGT